MKSNTFDKEKRKVPQHAGEGLYRPEHEHDACGVGMIVNIHGNKSHELVDAALKVLENMKLGCSGVCCFGGKTGFGRFRKFFRRHLCLIIITVRMRV